MSHFEEQMMAGHRVDVAAYYFGNYHREPRNEEHHGTGWTEWDLVRAGTPRFEGHQQPLEPLWGYADDCDPVAAEREFAAATAAGIDAFLVDWYWYEGKPFLQRPLDEVILPSTSPLRFALMWANHDWLDIFPAPDEREPQLLMSARVEPAEFVAITDRIIEEYMTSPRYWRVDGAAYFSFFQVTTLLRWWGGVDATRAILDGFRARARDAGIGDLHFAAVSNEFHQLDESSRIAFDALRDVGIDSVNDYNWNTLLGRETPSITYSEWYRRARAEWGRHIERYGDLFAPNVSVGWDSTPRTPPNTPVRAANFPFAPVVTPSSPAELTDAMQRAMDLASEPGRPPYVSLNAWNEWTEGSMLLPDVRNGTDRLDAIERATRTHREG